MYWAVSDGIGYFGLPEWDMDMGMFIGNLCHTMFGFVRGL